jgi:uncharacterized membrane protein (UPF0127 family)
VPARALVLARNITRGTVIGDRIEVANGLWGKFMGLMGRAELSVGAGMWLPESNGIHMMFMRFPIDCAFLGRPDRDGGRPVVGLSAAMPPWRGIVPFVRGAHGVLELPVGSITASSTEIGDHIVLQSVDEREISGS